MLIAGMTLVGTPSFDDYYFVFQSSDDAAFTKQKRMQAMIVTSQSDKIIEKSINDCIAVQPLSTMLKGPYNHQESRLTRG